MIGLELVKSMMKYLIRKFDFILLEANHIQY